MDAECHQHSVPSLLSKRRHPKANVTKRNQTKPTETFIPQLRRASPESPNHTQSHLLTPMNTQSHLKKPFPISATRNALNLSLCDLCGLLCSLAYSRTMTGGCQTSRLFGGSMSCSP